METVCRYCENCGAGLSAGMSFCETCGHKILAGLAAEVVCPGCGQSGASARELEENNFSSVGKMAREGADDADEDLDEETRRDIAEMYLSKPEIPEKLAIATWILILFVPFVNFLSVFIAPLTRGLKIFMSLFTLTFIGVILWASLGSFADPFYPKDVTLMVGFVWITCYISALVISRWASQNTYEDRMAEYDRALARWQHLNYCEKCDLVFFDDVPGKSAPIEETEDFLKGQYSDGQT